VRISFGIILGVILMVALAHPAKADFTVCNDTSAGTLEVAAAYNFDDGDDSWSRSEGFWPIAPGQCSTTLTDVGEGDSLYIFAWASSNQSLTWSGATNYSTNAMSFCVDGQSSAFLYKGDDAVPTCALGVTRPFRYAGVADSDGNLTYRIGD
jgi:uncharacterized membrane protein